MGTRADFYLGRSRDAEYLGSIAWDGYPDGIDAAVLSAKTPEDFRSAVREQIARDGGRLPEKGWPWPWDNSGTTDYAYALDEGKVYACCFGRAWFDPLKPEPDEDEPTNGCVVDAHPVTFPDMRARANVALPGSPESGLMVITISPTTSPTSDHSRKDGEGK